MAENRTATAGEVAATLCETRAADCRSRFLAVSQDKLLAGNARMFQNGGAAVVLNAS
jgi:hypothetical protein